MADKAESTQSTNKHMNLILVVDDEPVNLLVLGGVLEHHYRVRTARSGAEALLAAASEPQPDLILLDIMMPDMDGFEVLRLLRSNEATRTIPVIFATALSDEGSEQRGFEMGAADYIHKPIRAAIVHARVRAQLEAKAARDMLFKNNQRLKHKIDGGAQALEKAQMQLMQAEKMASLGQLAAGVAHEINNPIGFVGSNLGSLEGYLKDAFSIIEAYERGAAQPGMETTFAEVRALRESVDYDYLRRDAIDLLKESRDGIDRVRKIVSDLKDYSRVSTAEWQLGDLHQGLDSTLNMVWNELKYHCTVTKTYGDIPQIRCLPSQLNQVFMNLIVNAAHAIEGTGEITLSTERVGNDAVRVSVSDTGKGIAPTDLERIFEPFYTTKPIGKGTGLGLSLAWGIVERHHGRIEVHSEVGLGSTFMVTLPINPPEDDAAS
jgi:two-component system, NtrC family, sensor kinase